MTVKPGDFLSWLSATFEIGGNLYDRRRCQMTVKPGDFLSWLSATFEIGGNLYDRPAHETSRGGTGADVAGGAGAFGCTRKSGARHRRGRRRDGAPIRCGGAAAPA